MKIYPYFELLLVVSDVSIYFSFILTFYSYTENTESHNYVKYLLSLSFDVFFSFIV